MGEKSRLNWNVPRCIKFDCVGQKQRKRCLSCLRSNKYATRQEPLTATDRTE